MLRRAGRLSRCSRRRQHCRRWGAMAHSRMLRPTRGLRRCGSRRLHRSRCELAVPHRCMFRQACRLDWRRGPALRLLRRLRLRCWLCGARKRAVPHRGMLRQARGRLRGRWLQARCWCSLGFGRSRPRSRQGAMAHGGVLRQAGCLRLCRLRRVPRVLSCRWRGKRRCCCRGE